MLVLSRKAGERILIGDNIAITIVRLGPQGVRVGIEAPPHMPVVREELAIKMGDLPDPNAVAISGATALEATPSASNNGVSKGTASKGTASNHNAAQTPR